MEGPPQRTRKARPVIMEFIREALQGIFTAIGLFWTFRDGIPRGMSWLIRKYDKRSAPYADPQ